MTWKYYLLIRYLFIIPALTLAVMLIVKLNRVLVPYLTNQKLLAQAPPPQPTPRPRPPCYPSPFVNCEDAMGNIRNHTEKFKGYQTLKIDLDFNNLPPGLTAYRLVQKQNKTKNKNNIKH